MVCVYYTGLDTPTEKHFFMTPHIDRIVIKGT